MPASPRRKSVVVNVGAVKVGGAHPVVVQSMTNTDTADVTATVNQVMALAQRRLGACARHRQHRRCGAAAVPKIVETLRTFGVRRADHRRLSL